MPPKVRALLALGTLTALVAVATLQPLPHVWGQDKEAPTREAEQKAEEKTEKKSEEPAPVKDAEVKQEGRGEKTEKEPVKGEEKVPMKEVGRVPRRVKGKEPVKGEEKVPMTEEGDVPRNVEEKTPEGRPVPRKGDPEISKDPVPGRVRPAPGKEMKEPTDGNRPGMPIPKGGLPFNGGISFDAKNSSTCGKGHICYNYVLPTLKAPIGMITGTLEITLNIYQNGSTTPLVFTPPTLMESGVLTNGDHFCFAVDPTTFPGIDLAAGGFDFVASAKFSLAGTDTTVLVGSVPQGVILDKNNDYQIVCAPGGGTGITRGRIVYDGRTSTTCGPGQICFNLTLPTMLDAKGNVIATATGVIHLTIYQNGHPILSLPASPVLNDKTGGRYCFPIDPANIHHLNCELGGFDFVATANFSFNMATTPNTSATVGTDPTGIIAEVNNDYQCECKGDPDPGHEEKVGCCLGKENVVYQEDFQHAQEMESEYERIPSLEEQLVPGTFVVTDVKYIDQACRSWKLPAACLQTHDFSGNVLLINGLTNQKPPAPATAVIWSHKIELPSLAGVKEAEYRVCFRYLPLPQCCFDIPARPHAVLKGADGPLTLNSDSDTGCGRLYVATFHAVPGSTIKLEIELDGNGMGDGNDLLIDNISVAQIVKIPAGIVTFMSGQTPTVGGVFDATFSTTLSAPYSWEWELYAGDPSIAANYLYSGTPNAASGTFPGLPVNDGNGVSIQYWVKLKVKSDCNEWTAKSHPVGEKSRKLNADPPNDDLDPQPVKRRKEAPAAKKRSE